MTQFSFNLGFYGPVSDLYVTTALMNGIRICFNNKGKVWHNIIHDDNIYQLAIETNSEDDAFAVFDVFRSCINVVYGTLLIDLDSVQAYTEDDLTQSSINMRGPYIYDGALLREAFPMTVNALKQGNHSVAILKYCVSQKLFPVHPIDFSPYGSNSYRSMLISDQIMIGYAVIISYSIIEELGIDVKASREMPSSIDGRWNPVVVQSLRDRLATVGINPNERMCWLSRQGCIRPLKKEIALEGLSGWNNGIDILDSQIDVVDAILEVSYIRSCLAAHANASRLQSLYPIDAQNANNLARTLLIEVLKQK